MHFTVEAHRIASDYLTQGAIVIDATAGNGHDTLFLSEGVGSTGLVYAIDIQQQAIETVRNKLSTAGLLARVRLVLGDHAALATYIDPNHIGSVRVAIFNLGYLPLGDKSKVTQPTTTIAGLDGAARMLGPGGLLSILAYRGHVGGDEEADAVRTWIEAHRSTWRIEELVDPNHPKSPILWSLEKGRG